MFETIFLAMIIAKIKRYKIKPLFKTWTVYPVFFLEIVHLVFQANIFMGNYFFVQYAPILKKTYLFLCIIPIIVYKEYLTGIIGSLFVFAGSALNNFVMAQNNGKMPVFPNFSYITGYADPAAIERINGIHVLGRTDMNWWFFSDVIDVGWSVLSVGDMLIRVFVLLTIYKTIKVMNLKIYGPKKKPIKESDMPVENLLQTDHIIASEEPIVKDEKTASQSTRK